MRESGVEVFRVPLGDAAARITRLNGGDPRTAFVLVPGLSIAPTYFEFVAPGLAALGPVVAIELPGIGGLPGAPDGGTVEEASRQLEHVVAVLGLERPVLVGHSMGGQIVADLATRIPLAGLVVVGPIVDPTRRTVPRTLVAFARSSVHEPLSVVIIALLSYALAGRSRLRLTLPSTTRYPIERALARVSAPTRLLSGRWDALAGSPWLAGLVDPDADRLAAVVPGAAHSVVHDHAPAVIAACAELVGAPEPRHPDREMRTGRGPVFRLREIRLRLLEFTLMREQEDIALRLVKQWKLGLRDEASRPTGSPDRLAGEGRRARRPRTVRAPLR